MAATLDELSGGKFTAVGILSVKVHGHFIGEDNYTTQESERLIRLPMWYGITKEIQKQVVENITDYITNKLS